MLFTREKFDRFMSAWDDLWIERLAGLEARLTEEDPRRWALLLEKYFTMRGDEEGLMLAQAITKKVAPKKRGRKPKGEVNVSVSEG